jgi:hypothetical protein
VQLGTATTPSEMTGKQVGEGVGQAIAEKPAAPPPPPPPRKKSDPNPSDDATPATSSGQLDAHSSIARKSLGGGTGNNTETNGGPIGGLAPGSAYARKSQGDGGGNDAGDNNHIDKGGSLVTETALTRKDQGDGGGSDTRGGGGTSTITGSAKIVNPGGGHNQLTGATAQDTH